MRRPFVIARNVSSVEGIDNHKLGHTRGHGTAADQGLACSNAEHGIGHGKVPYLAESVGEVNMRLMEQIKQVFDPNLILNPGKVCYML